MERELEGARWELTQAQFGPYAGAYLTNPSHARGPSLQHLFDLCPPQPAWRVLDIATGASHTALTFAPHVRQVVAVDVTPEMLEVAHHHAVTRGVTNLALALADAARVPFAPATFDLVTCRLAAHHFPDVAAAVREMARVCRPGGTVAVVDHVVPLHSATARYINAFERLRDPSHVRCYPLADWEGFFLTAGLEVVHTEEYRKAVDLDEWASHANVSPTDRIRLEVMLVQAPAYARAALTPGREAGRMTFYLTEAVVIGKR